jgi:hypothetical protein
MADNMADNTNNNDDDDLEIDLDEMGDEDGQANHSYHDADAPRLQRTAKNTRITYNNVDGELR